MNIEVEIKVKVENLAEIKEKVSKMGQLVKAVKQIDDYYIPVHRNFFTHKPNPIEWLRVRTNPNKVVLEYTRKVNPRDDGDYDYAEEYETEIKSPEEMAKILEFLDFKKILTVEKEREYWMCGKIEAALDKVKDLGEFIEAEAKGDFANDKEAKKACFKFLEEVGIQNPENAQVKKGYPQMLFEKLDRN